jgi:hypothetical protein
VWKDIERQPRPKRPESEDTMKYKTTAKAIRRGYPKILGVDYCAMHGMLQKRSAVACSSGTLGWNFDVYDVGDIVPGACICTGYRNVPCNVKFSYKAMSACDLEATADNCEELLAQFLKSIWS